MNTMTTAATTTTLIVTAILGALASSVGVASTTGDSAGVLQETVSYADLNVSTPQAARTLYDRIRSAAARECSPLDHGDLASKKSLDACASKAIADAVNAVDQPALLAVYNSKHTHPLPVVAAVEKNR